MDSLNEVTKNPTSGYGRVRWQSGGKTVNMVKTFKKSRWS